MSVIVCATDFSSASKAVVAKAGELSKLFGVPLELFHVFDLPFAPDVLDEITDTLRTSAEAAIAVQAEPLRAIGVDVRTFVQLGVKDDIVRHARAVDASLLVLGTHSRKGAARFFLGSVAEHAIRTAPCPVVVIPAATQGRPPRARTSAALEIVVGIDFSPASDAALGWLRRLMERASCNVRLVHLYAPAREHARLGFAPPMPFEVNSEVVTTLARDLRAHVHAQVGTDFALRIRPDWGGEEDPLAWEAEMDDADLLVIGTSQTRRSTALATVRGRGSRSSASQPGTGGEAGAACAGANGAGGDGLFSRGQSAIPQAYRLLQASGGDVVRPTWPAPTGRPRTDAPGGD